MQNGTGSAGGSKASQKTKEAGNVRAIVKTKETGTGHFIITLAAILILVSAITAIAWMWATSLEDNQKVLDDVTLQFREANANEMSLEIANSMRVLWQIPRAQVDMMKRPSFAYDHTTPANQATFDAAVSYMWPKTERELHLNSVLEDGSNRTYNPYIGTIMAFPVDSSGNPSTSMGHART